MTRRDFKLSHDSPGTLQVSGALVFANAAAAMKAIRQSLAAAPIQQLDLAGVEDSDSAGLACVLAVLAGAGRSLTVAHVPAGMQALAQVCEVDGLLK